MRTWRVRDVMTTDVVSVGEWTAYREIVDRLASRRISGVPVTDYFGHVGGVVSESDLMLRVEAGGQPPRHRLFDGPHARAVKAKATGTVAGDVMTAPAVTVMPDTPLSTAARIMNTEAIKRLPVVDDLGRLVGIVSRGDVLRVYLRPDGEIRQDVVQEVLRRVLTVEPGQVRVSVQDGVVTLDGRLERRSAAELAARLSRKVPGVIDVVDRLSFDFDDGALVRLLPHPFEAESYEPRVLRH